MVTKQKAPNILNEIGLILAKIHMVTKRLNAWARDGLSLILAKIHMVTKPKIGVM